MIRLLILFVFGTFLFSCSNEKRTPYQFNLTVNDSSNVNQNYLDEFQLKLEMNLKNEFTKMLDTNNSSTKIFKTDSSFTTNLKQKVIEITTPLCKDLDKSYTILNMDKLVIHYEIMMNDFLEIEVSNNEILYQKNNEPLKSTNITPELWNKLKSDCTCDSTYGLNTIFDNVLIQQEQTTVYRMSNNLTSGYSSCFKILTNADPLTEVISYIDKIK